MCAVYFSEVVFKRQFVASFGHNIVIVRFSQFSLTAAVRINNHRKQNKKDKNEMRVWKDLISGDEFFSDGFPHEITMNNACIEAKAKYITKGAVDVDIGCRDDEHEEEAEGETVVDIQDKFQLNEVQGFSKKEFMMWAKGYLAKVTAKLTEAGKEDRIPEFKKGATQLVKLIAGKWDEMQLFVGDKMDYEGAMCFSYQKEQDDEGPTFLYFADGLKETKY